MTHSNVPSDSREGLRGKTAPTRRPLHPDLQKPVDVVAQPNTVDVFLRLLGEQCGLYEQVREVGQRQALLIEAGDTQGLLTVLHERQALIEAVSQLNRRLIPHREAWGRLVDDADDGLRAKVRGLIDRTQTLLSVILQQDESDRRALQQRLAGTDDELDQVARTRRAGQVYRKAGESGPSADTPGTSLFTDQRG